MNDERASVVLDSDGVEQIIDRLAARGYRIIGPTERDGAIVLSEIASGAELPWGRGDMQGPGRCRLEDRDDGMAFGYAVGPDSARRFLQPPRETIVTIRPVGDTFEVDEPARSDTAIAFIGLRGCDVAAIGVQDRVLAVGPNPDPGYVDRRARSFVVAVTCGSPAETCFCASMGTGPEPSGGYDVRLTELGPDDHRFVAEAGSDEGAGVLAELAGRAVERTDDEAVAEVVERSRAQMARHLDPATARDVLARALDHPRWDDVASRCLSCTNCTLVCPTCFCTAVEDRSPLGADHHDRSRRWDSCFTFEHSHLHGVGPVRADTRARYRQWLTHKLATWWDQFGESGCVGCGRCITWCPAGIDLTEEVAAMSQLAALGPGATT